MLVTSALPYANGDIHLGHLVEYLQTDFWVRYQKMIGKEALYICADDTHGTPVMISAKEKKITPEELIKYYQDRHTADFKDFEIKFDNYYTTHSKENQMLATEFYKAMQAGEHIVTKKVEQLYCEKDKMFLPDRFVKGTCPKCQAAAQYGDSCDHCGATYSTSDLENPGCVVCGEKPVLKESEHLFFALNHFKDFLQAWIAKHTNTEISKKLSEWFNEDLRDWNISRDEPYFGFKIPDKADKYFYVWLDAPIGYISSTIDWCKKNDCNYEDYWKNEETEIYHFIGKDIIYFHALFWPAMLKTAGYNLPEQVFVHGFLTVNGEKMSKSKGTFITARKYLDLLNPLYLRFYYASKLSSGIDDIDFNLDDFFNKVNSELIGKITNLASRSVQILNKHDLAVIESDEKGNELIAFARGKKDIIAKYYEQREFSRVIMELRDIAETANRFMEEQQPWQVIKSDKAKASQILSAVVNVFRIIAIYLKPILPSYVENVEKLFAENNYTWKDIDTTLTNIKPAKYEHLLQRIDREALDKLTAE